MLALLVVATLVGTSAAIVCTPLLCEGASQPVLHCPGGTIKGGGFCGCTDACAKVEGQVCQAEYVHSMLPAGTCDLGLYCQKLENMVFGRGVCVQNRPAVDLGLHRQLVVRETVPHRTKCEQMRITAMITMVIWAGKWTPKCDAEGNFLPQQCDVSGHCFCVTSDGAVIDGTKVLGPAACSNAEILTTPGPADADTATGSQPVVVRQLSTQASTRCQQMRRASLMSMVVWSGKWTPTCDAEGNFTPHQCYFSGVCFCVTADGQKIEGSDGLGSDCLL